MTKSNTKNLEPFDPEIERTFLKLRNLVEEILSPRKQTKMEKTPSPVGARAAIGAAGAQNNRRT